jgi:hypothetical protein
MCQGGAPADVSTSFYRNWTTGSIATVDDYGTHTGVSAGSTTSQTSGFLNDNNPRLRCPAMGTYPSGGVNVQPSIMFNGQNIAGSTQSVVVGQQIALTASYGNITPTSQSWTVPGTGSNPPTAVGGFSIGPSSTTGGTTAVTLNQQSTTFYWSIPNNPNTVTFTLNYGSGQTATAQANFTVAGVSSPSMSVQSPTNGTLSINTLTGCSQQSGGPYLVYGSVSGPAPGCTGTTTGQAGILFTNPSGTQPSGGGSFSFVQLINSDTRSYSSNAGSLTCSHSAGLDGQYPYAGQASATSATDAPEAPLPSTYTSASRSFNATMYLMWTSSQVNSIPVPLVYQTWQFSGSTTQSNGTWGTPSGSGGPVGGVTATNGSYPTWGNIATETCH